MFKNKNLSQIRKRDGTTGPFDDSRISNAVLKAMKAAGEGGEKESILVAKSVVKDLEKLAKAQAKGYLPTVEGVQDLVEKQLILHNFVQTSKAYILYRERRSELRREKGEMPQEVRELVNQTKVYFCTKL